jgi:hypothetical protein
MRLISLLSIATLGLALAACGSSSPSSSSSSSAGASSGSSAADSANQGASSTYRQSLKFADCMRTHGVSNFPDPQANGGTKLQIQSTNGSTEVNGVSVNGPAFQSALQTCHSDLPNGGQPGQLSASRRKQALAFSECMRKHGITNFPDPTFSSGGAQLRLTPSMGIDPNSPAFKSAQAACGLPFGASSSAASSAAPSS